MCVALPFLVCLGSEIQDSGVSLGERYRELFSGLLVTAERCCFHA